MPRLIVASEPESLRLECLLGDGGKLVEGLDVLVGHLSQYLAVELDASELQTVHETRVGDVVHAGGSVDAGPPYRRPYTTCIIGTSLTT